MAADSCRNVQFVQWYFCPGIQGTHGGWVCLWLGLQPGNELPLQVLESGYNRQSTVLMQPHSLCLVSQIPTYFICSGDGDGKAYIWDWKTTKLLSKWKAHDDVCIQVAFWSSLCNNNLPHHIPPHLRFTTTCRYCGTPTRPARWQLLGGMAWSSFGIEIVESGFSYSLEEVLCNMGFLLNSHNIWPCLK